MFCYKCGTALPEGAQFCFQCGASMGDIAAAPVPSGAAAPETILMQGAGQVIKSAVLANTGSVILTNKRLVFNRGGNIIMGKVLTDGKFQFEIPLSDVVRVSEGKKGVVRTIVLERSSGEAVHFYFSKSGQWLITIQSAVEQARRGL